MFAKIYLVLLFGFACGPSRSSGQRQSGISKRSFEGCPLRFIFPGTNWCGDGSRAKNIDDLGYFKNTDVCCREHDMCPKNIAGLTEKFGLVNQDPFTRSHCDCDRKFYDCLMSEATALNRFITKLYFHVIPDKCFTEKTSEVGPFGETLYEWVETSKFLNLKEELYGICELDIPRAIEETLGL